MRASRASHSALGQVGVLHGLDPDALREIGGAMRSLHLPGGAMLFDQGDSGDTLYIVAHGLLRVSVAGPNGTRRTIAELGRGASVGEMALLTGEPRSARVEAIRDSLLFSLSSAAFTSVVERHPRVMTQLARELVARVERSIRGAPVRHSLSTICIVPATPGVRVSEFCRQLANSLSTLGPTMHLTRERVHAALAGSIPSSADDADDGHLIAWLNEQEERFRYLLYEPDPADPAWSRRCERQADRILLIGHSDSQIATPRYIPAGTARRELVLINKSGPVPGCMRRWLAAYPEAQGWHHVTEGAAADVARVARLISGNGIGLLLSGGGARAFAHIGVLRAMQEAGITIDAIGGVSGGAIVGGQFAAGTSAEEIKEIARDEFLRRGRLFDYTMPIVSLIRGQRFAAMLQRMFGDAAIEDLPVRFFCLSANLSRATVRMHDRDLTWRAVGASMSIPGIGPPTCENGELLIDGSVLHNLPVEIMREVCQGRLIAVDASAERDLTVDRSWLEFPSPLRLLAWRPWRRRGRKVPTILEILFRAAMLGSIRAERNVPELVDLYLHPPLRGVALLDFKSLDRVEEAGYRYAVEALRSWPTKPTETNPR